MASRCCALVFFFVPVFLIGAVDAYLLSAAPADQDHFANLEQWQVIEEANARREWEVAVVDHADDLKVWNNLMAKFVARLEQNLNLKENLIKVVSLLAQSHSPLPRQEFPTVIRIGKWISEISPTRWCGDNRMKLWTSLVDLDAYGETSRKEGLPNAKVPWRILKKESDVTNAGFEARKMSSSYPLLSLTETEDKDVEEAVAEADILLARNQVRWNSFLATVPKPLAETRTDPSPISVEISVLDGETIPLNDVHSDITFAQLKDRVTKHEAAQVLLGVRDEQTGAYNVQNEGGVYYQWYLEEESTLTPLRRTRTLKSQGVVDGSTIRLIATPWWQSYWLDDYPQESLPFHLARHMRLALLKRLGPGWSVEISERPCGDTLADLSDLKLIIAHNGQSHDGLITRTRIP